MQQFFTYQFLERSTQNQIPTVKNPASLELHVGDDTTLAGYQLAATADTDRIPRAVKIALPNGAFIYFNAYVTLVQTPSLTVNQAVETVMTLSYVNQPTRYAS